MTQVLPRLDHLLDDDGSVSFTAIADLLRLASQFRSRKSIADWCETLADELDRFDDDGPDGATAIEILQQNLGVRLPVARLLWWLAAAPNRIHSSKELGAAIGTTPATIKVYVCLVRNSFEGLGLENPLRTVWGQGYSLTDAAAGFLKTSSCRIRKSER